MSNVPTITNPCCFGITLQSGTKIIAAFHITVLVLIMIYVTFYVWLAEFKFEEAGLPVVSRLLILLWIVILLIVVFLCVFYVILFLGANQRDITKIRIYLVFFTVEFSLHVLGILEESFGSTPVAATAVVLTVLAFIPKIYTGYVTFRFYKELENEEPAKAEYLETIPYP